MQKLYTFYPQKVDTQTCTKLHLIPGDLFMTRHPQRPRCFRPTIAKCLTSCTFIMSFFQAKMCLKYCSLRERFELSAGLCLVYLYGRALCLVYLYGRALCLVYLYGRANRYFTWCLPVIVRYSLKSSNLLQANTTSISILWTMWRSMQARMCICLSRHDNLHVWEAASEISPSFMLHMLSSSINAPSNPTITHTCPMLIPVHVKCCACSSTLGIRIGFCLTREVRISTCFLTTLHLLIAKIRGMTSRSLSVRSLNFKNAGSTVPFSAFLSSFLKNLSASSAYVYACVH